MPKARIIIEVETTNDEINSDMFSDVQDHIEDLFWVGVVTKVDIEKVPQ
jgi:hypothetical protein